jgi:hypothetical protein
MSNGNPTATPPTTLNFAFPLMYSNQAQKDVVLNTDLVAIDSLIQLNVIDLGTDAPPSSPADQDKHIVGTSPTGAWTGQANAIAIYQANGSFWTFYAPQTGWVAFNVANVSLYSWSGTAWVMLATVVGGSNLGDLAALASVLNLVDIANLPLTPGGMIQVNPAGTHFIEVTPLAAFTPTAMMLALIFGG